MYTLWKHSTAKIEGVADNFFANVYLTYVTIKSFSSASERGLHVSKSLPFLYTSALSLLFLFVLLNHRTIFSTHNRGCIRM